MRKGSDLRPAENRQEPLSHGYGMVGGLCTTPTDYSDISNRSHQPKNPVMRFDSREKVLRKCSVRRSKVEPLDSSWALGWEINHTEKGNFLRHGGGNPGYSCFVAASVERKSGYVIMTNGENSGYYGVTAKLITGEILSQFLGGKLRGASE